MVQGRNLIGDHTRCVWRRASTRKHLVKERPKRVRNEISTLFRPATRKHRCRAVRRFLTERPELTVLVYPVEIVARQDEPNANVRRWDEIPRDARGSVSPSQSRSPVAVVVGHTTQPLRIVWSCLRATRVHRARARVSKFTIRCRCRSLATRLINNNFRTSLIARKKVKARIRLRIKDWNCIEITYYHIGYWILTNQNKEVKD